jgi:hypothetical protein
MYSLLTLVLLLRDRSLALCLRHLGIPLGARFLIATGQGRKQFLTSPSWRGAYLGSIEC